MWTEIRDLDRPGLGNSKLQSHGRFQVLIVPYQSGFSDTCLKSVWCLVELVCLVLVIHVLSLVFGGASLSGFSDTCLESVWCLVELVCLVLVIHVLSLSGVW